MKHRVSLNLLYAFGTGCLVAGAAVLAVLTAPSQAPSGSVAAPPAKAAPSPPPPLVSFESLEHKVEAPVGSEEKEAISISLEGGTYFLGLASYCTQQSISVKAAPNANTNLTQTLNLKVFNAKGAIFYSDSDQAYVGKQAEFLIPQGKLSEGKYSALVSSTLSPPGQEVGSLIPFEVMKCDKAR